VLGSQAVNPKRSKAEPIHPTLFEMGKLGEPEKLASSPVERSYSLAGILLGTSSFTADGWQTTSYPQGMKSADYLKYYASQFQTVEVDSTFYGTPSATTVKRWYEKTSEDFIFAAKVPQIITHEKALVDCASEFEEFVKTMDILGPKLGPMVFQFPSFDRWKFSKQESFLAVLIPFLKKLPADHKFVVEIRNKKWLDAKFADVLREHNVAWALTDTSFVLGEYLEVSYTNCRNSSTQLVRSSRRSTTTVGMAHRLSNSSWTCEARKNHRPIPYNTERRESSGRRN